jgi:hypothetical protein
VDDGELEERIGDVRSIIDARAYTASELLLSLPNIERRHVAGNRCVVVARPLSAICRREVLLVLAVIYLASTASPAVQAPKRILFIGNSLTTANDLPGLVERIARAAGDLFECTTVAFPDHGLEEHWSRGDAQRAIRKGGWTFVVLQQGPSALPESRILLRQYVQRFDAEVRRAGARTALYMVWPSTARRGDFDAVSMSYSIAAKDVGALLLPAGDAWRAAWRRESTVGLYARDGFHPSLAGSYLAALVVYQGLSGKPAATLPTILSMPPKTMTLLHEAAAETITRR